MVKREENEDNICHWEECLSQYETAEDLFNHICAAHIGRKSAGTLSLECKWTGCRAKASKRDHLTSHCRVHVALKPHVCSICTKAFKRPQDLKKHEKIHTEEHQAQHHRVSKAAAAGMSGNGISAGKLGAQPRGQQQPPPAHTGPSAIPQLAAPYQFSFPQLGFPYPGLAGHQQQPPSHGVGGHHQQHPAAPAAQQQQQHQQSQQQPSQGQFPLGGANADQLAQFIALQQQLNSQAQMAAATGLSLPSSTIPNLQANLSGALALQLNQMLGAQAMQYLQGVPAMYPYGNFGGGGAGVYPAPNQQQQQGPNGSHASVAAAMPAPHLNMATTTTTTTTSQPQVAPGSSLYPTLPPSLYAPGNTNGSAVLPPIPSAHAQHQQQTRLPPLHRAVKPDEHPSPASSSRSHESGSYSSSLSPRNLPALSPASSLTPEGSFSPTPGPEQQRKLQQSENQVAGKKRGFEEATGQLLSNLTNKRFQDQDAVNAQLDSLSTFLLTPDAHHPPLPPHHSGSYIPGQNQHDDAASSSGSENGSTGPRFEHEEVDAINQLLLSLNQSLDSDLAPPPPPSSSNGQQPPSHLGGGGEYQQHHSLPGSAAHAASAAASYAAHAPIASTSLYPSLPNGLGYPNMYQQQHNGNAAAYDPSSLLQHHAPALPQHKSVPAPSLAHDYRPTQYHHVARLQRAAPSASAPPQVEPEMEIDDDVVDAAEALLRAGAVNRARSVPTSKPTLPSLSTAVGVHAPGAPAEELRLRPIVTSPSAAARLPPIRDLLSIRTSPAGHDSGDSPNSPAASSSSTTPSSTSSATTAPPLYPSLSSIQSTSTSRPVSAGGVERLTHRVHKLRLPSTSSSGDEVSSASVGREDDADLSASSGEEDEDRPTWFKKSRVESPANMATPRSAAISESGSVTPEPATVKQEEEDADLHNDHDEENQHRDSAAEASKKDDLARQELEARAQVIERRKAVIAYLAMYVNHKYREQLARKSMAHVRKAIKKPSPLSQEQQQSPAAVKAEH
ncbi:hypothetical protein JCM3774_004685 [Rhodotorula dairenensis]